MDDCAATRDVFDSRPVRTSTASRGPTTTAASDAICRSGIFTTSLESQLRALASRRRPRSLLRVHNDRKGSEREPHSKSFHRLISIEIVGYG